MIKEKNSVSLEICIKNTLRSGFFRSLVLTKKVLYILTLFILLISCVESTSESISSNTHNSLIREYTLYVPDSYKGTSSVPLLFNFHGFGGTVSDYMKSADMRSLADSENFILVYPQGALLDKSSHWNSSLPSADNKSNVDDLGFIEALIDELSLKYTIDSKRVYAVGYSNGSFFSYALACYKSDKIAGIASVSGTLTDTSATCNPTHPMAMINIHGTADSVVPYAGNIYYTSVDANLNFWINHNKTNLTPIKNTVVDNGTTIEHYQYTEGTNNVAIEHYKIINGGHVWFDINYQGSNTGKLIWDYLSKYDINGLISSE